MIAAHPVLQQKYRKCFPSHHSACFEILGFDILIDQEMKVWVLEVNHDPAFLSDMKVHREVIDQLLTDTFRLLNAEDRKFTQQVNNIGHKQIFAPFIFEESIVSKMFC